MNQLKRTDVALYWIMLAVGSLLLSGVFAMFIALARLPGLSSLFTDPAFFRRALVVHVDLGVSVWFTALPVALFHLLNRERAMRIPEKIAISLALAGVMLSILSGFSGQGTPYLSNYIPVVSHPLFIAGLVIYFAGVGLSYLTAGLLEPMHERKGASEIEKGILLGQFGIRLGALYFLVTLATLAISWLRGPDQIAGSNYFEMIMWGGGHVLQFSNVSFMLVCWILLLTSWLGSRNGELPLSRRKAFLVFVWIGLPMLLVPIAAAQEVFSPAHRESFTQLMRWGIFPPVLLFLLMTLPKAFRASKNGGWKDLRALTFFLSAALIVCGFIFGALVRAPDLRLPGHYHASIGAVTLAFMGAVYVVLHDLKRMPLEMIVSARASWQAFLTGFGQLAFSGGMFIAGTYGMARKIYGTEQQIQHPGQNVGMWVMGVGGVLALAGGLLFAVNVSRYLMGTLGRGSSRKWRRIPGAAAAK